jgi:hypothetical protein
MIKNLIIFIRTKYFYFVIGAFLFLILLPFILWLIAHILPIYPGYKKSLLYNYTLIVPIIAPLSTLSISLTTLFITYAIYKNFDIKKQFHQRQFDTLLQMMEEISKCEIKVYTVNKMEGINNTSIIGFYTFGIFGDYKDMHNKSAFYTTTDKVEVLFPFLKLYNNPLIPTSISEKILRFFPLPEMKKVSIFDVNSYNLMQPFNFSNDLIDENVVFEYMLKGDFGENVKRLRLAIEQWFDRFGAVDLNNNTFIPVNKIKGHP